ncbi:MAG: class I SAM-dependent methyltransferase [Egibacteraceae bacterium]
MTDPGPTNRWLSASSDAGSRAEGYDASWERLAATGADVHGEASFVDGLGPATVLDAGCGTGRVAIELARRGVDVVGVDLDPGMLEVARGKAPELRWVEWDLATVDLGRRFDVAVAAGNVLIFLTPGTEAAVVANLARHLAPAGRLVAGFQLSEDRLPLALHDEHCRAAGLVTVERYATWDRAPYDGGDYAVTVSARPAEPPA